MMRQKLQTTSIPKIEFEDMHGTITLFEDYYDYIKPLGCGSFGFVVSAMDRESGEHVALKVCQSGLKNLFILLLIFLLIQIVDTSNPTAVKCIRKEAEILESLGQNPNVIGFRHVSFSLWSNFRLENSLTTSSWPSRMPMEAHSLISSKDGVAIIRNWKMKKRVKF